MVISGWTAGCASSSRTLTQIRIEKMCRKGEIRVDGGRVKPATRVEVGQSVRIPPLSAEDHQPAPMVARSGVTRSDAEMIQAAVLWKDEHIIALNKPSGLASQGGSGQGDRHVDGLTEALMFGYKDRPKLVHRLDKDTSGILLLARTDRVARGLSEALRHRNVRKIYWAAVAGVPHPRAGSIKFGLVKAPGRGRGGEAEKMICVHPARGGNNRRRQARPYRLRGDDHAGQPGRLAGPGADHRAHAPVARPYRRDRPPDHR